MKVAVAQVILSSDVDTNVLKISKYISLASKENIDIICFPECAITGYVRDFYIVDREEILETLADIQEKVREDSVTVIVGTPYFERDNRFNSAIVLLPNGDRHIYHKINLTSSETAYFKSGKKPTTFQIDGVTFGILICRDQNDALLAHDYKQLGVDVLFILSAHFYEPQEAIRKRDKNRALPIARAVENHLCVLKANAVGSAGGKISLGGSIIVDSNGIVLQEADQMSELILSCDLIRGTQKENEVIIHKNKWLSDC